VGASIKGEGTATPVSKAQNVEESSSAMESYYNFEQKMKDIFLLQNPKSSASLRP
jgi:hypothetical protein